LTSLPFKGLRDFIEQVRHDSLDRIWWALTTPWASSGCAEDDLLDNLVDGSKVHYSSQA